MSSLNVTAIVESSGTSPAPSAGDVDTTCGAVRSPSGEASIATSPSGEASIAMSGLAASGGGGASAVADLRLSPHANSEMASANRDARGMQSPTGRRHESQYAPARETIYADPS